MGSAHYPPQSTLHSHHWNPRGWLILIPSSVGGPHHFCRAILFCRFGLLSPNFPCTFLPFSFSSFRVVPSSFPCSLNSFNPFHARFSFRLGFCSSRFLPNSHRHGRWQRSESQDGSRKELGEAEGRQRKPTGIKQESDDDPVSGVRKNILCVFHSQFLPENASEILRLKQEDPTFPLLFLFVQIFLFIFH